MHTTTTTVCKDVTIRHRFQAGDTVTRIEPIRSSGPKVIAKVGTYPHDLPEGCGRNGYPSRDGQGIYVYVGTSAWDFVDTVDGLYKLVPSKPDVTYTITIEQRGAIGVHNIAFVEGLQDLIRESAWIRSGETFDITVDMVDSWGDLQTKKLHVQK